MKKHSFLLAFVLVATTIAAQTKPLHQLQQDFEDLRFGLFTHFALPTYVPADWSDPDLSPKVLDAPKLDCGQWADAALSANMTYGCLSVKHHNGFCMWATETTDYNVMNSLGHLSSQVRPQQKIPRPALLRGRPTKPR